ncbi:MULTISPECIES: Sec-independent protein translocase protein TatB [unclassified Sphingomonas]|uniref:Sec-independent protein translocase protein TatB n=1 Tax=unclassified Sphingomonas TaxID=196159 RepID=UPI0021513F38|nr:MULTISPECIES: Sec-independent protein translocase protein TatB [unclassified Sphingomonas]MCR5871739.1 Sec-independent protein translocase protein TatB [Sphingomonas sp. J344]UUX99973.1 Sec-independent protein translocase protein TatB [Sphingomonas sp. J315]
MLDFNAPEFLVVGIVALLVIGPKDLPKAMRFVGQWVGKARRVASQFRSGLDTMVRESELAEMEKKWAEENARIMREYPPEKMLAGPMHNPDEAGAESARLAEDMGDAAPVLTPAPEFKGDPVEPVPDAPVATPARKPRTPRKKKAES